MLKAFGNSSVRAFIAKNVLIGKQSRSFSIYNTFSLVVPSSSAVFSFNGPFVRTLSSGALANVAQIVVMRKASSETSSCADPNELVIDNHARVAFWDYVSKKPPKNVLVNMERTFSKLLQEGKIQLRFLIPKDVVDSLAAAGDEFLNSLKEHNASLELTDWKLPEGVLTMVCPIDSVADCFKKILPKLDDGKIRLLLHNSFSYVIMGRSGIAKKELLKKKKLKPDQFQFHKILCPYSTDRVYGMKGDEETLLYFLNYLIEMIKKNPHSPMEIPFNKQSHVGALVEKYGGFGADYSGSRDDGNVTLKFTIPKELIAQLKCAEGEYGLKTIRALTGVEFKARNPNEKRVLTSVKATGHPLQLEQLCYMLKQSLEMSEAGKAYLRGEWKNHKEEQDDNDD